MVIYHELLWIFTQLPGDYIVLDTETTGLSDEDGLPDIVTLGITVVRNRRLLQSIEFETRPLKRISDVASALHGITNEQAAEFASFESQWSKMSEYLEEQLIVIHNASFDWPVLIDYMARYQLTMPAIIGVFCSQKAAIPWAQALGLQCSRRGPSLDILIEALGLEDLRAERGGIHGSGIDSRQTVQVVETLRQYGLQSS